MTTTPLRWREVAVAAAAACLVAAVMHWPLPLHLGRDIPKDLGDPLVQAWQVAWGGHALAHQPLDFFQANIFWPLPNSLAFSDALVGYAPLGLIGSGAHAAVVRYDVLFLFAYALAFVGPYLLARELGFGSAGAAVAGAAFAYSPWRLEQDGHLHVISSGGIPLSLFLLLRGYRRRAPGTVFAGWVVAAWQLSLGFTLGLQLAYLLAALAVVAALLWWRRRPCTDRRVLAATATGIAAFALVALLLARPYLEVREDHPEARRSPTHVALFSGPPWSFLVAPEENLVWGRVTEPLRKRLNAPAEQTLFPGAAIVVLAAVGVLWAGPRRRLRVAIALAVAVVALLSLGFREPGNGVPYPYRLLYEYAPGWQAIRVPGRLMTLTSLGLALLAAAGTQAILGSLWRRTALGGGRPAVVTGAAGILLVGAILIEGSGFDLREGSPGPRHPTVPPVPAGQLGIPAPQLHLPLSVDARRRYVLWSTEGFPKIVNGQASFEPLALTQLERRVARFPDRESVRLLRSLGVRSVVWHPDLASRSERKELGSRPLTGLALTREDRGDVVVYRMSTPGAAS